MLSAVLAILTPKIHGCGKEDELDIRKLGLRPSGLQISY